MSICANFDTPTATITDLLKVECVCNRCSGATRLFLVAASTHIQSFWKFFRIYLHKQEILTKTLIFGLDL